MKVEDFNINPEPAAGENELLEPPQIPNETKTEEEAAVSAVKEKPRKAESLKKLKAENEELKAEIAFLKDKNLRLLAEFDNFRKRKLLETLEITESVKRELLLALLPILDDAQRLLAQPANEGEVLRQGYSLIFEKFRQALTAAGLKPMDSHGKPFDPDLHEAMMTVESPNGESGSIAEVIEPGYFLNDKVLRHAKVIVCK